MAYYSVEPFGEAQEEYRAALIASTTANTARDPDKRKRAFEVTEFMRPGYLMDTAEGPVGEDALLQKAKAIFGVMGAGRQGKETNKEPTYVGTTGDGTTKAGGK